MEDHFNRLLNVEGATSSSGKGGFIEEVGFIASAVYTGSKAGYVFKKDVKGLGYYIDRYGKVSGEYDDANDDIEGGQHSGSRKRKLETSGNL